MNKLIIAGGRDFNNYKEMRKEYEYFTYTNKMTNVSIISGMARGADTLGIQLAQEYGLPLTEMPAEWDKYGKSAGYRRNEKMAQIASHALIFWDGQSKGTGHMIDLSKKYNLNFKIINY